MTWTSPEARDALLEYKRFREARGEAITPGTPLIAGIGESLTVSGYEWRWYRLLERANLKEKSENQYVLKIHTLRKFFRSNCIGVDESFREHWMGHKGGYLDESYFRAEEQRHLEEYRKAIPHQSLYASEVGEEERRKRALIDFARFQGWSDERIRQLTEILQRAKTVDDAAEEFRRLRAEEVKVPDGESLRKLGENGNRKHRITEGEDEMLRPLDQGWTLERELNGGERFLVRRN